MGRFNVLPVLLIATLAMVLSAGCQQMQHRKKSTEPGKTSRKTTPAKTTPAKSTTAMKKSTASSSSAWMTSRAYPTGDQATSALLVNRSAPEEVIAGTPYDYTIKVTNLTSEMLENVTVTELFADGYEFETANPKPENGSVSPEWIFASLGPKQSRTITIRGKATGIGSIQNCNEISWASRLCTTTEVTKPSLAMRLTGTAKATSCDPLVYKCVLTNNGTGTARNVVMEHRLPKGMRTMEGQTVMRANVGDLASGQSREFTIRVKVDGDGEYSQKCTARADGDLTAESNAVATVIENPTLAIEKTGPDRAYFGRNLDYEILVKNTSKVTAKDTVVEDVLPSGTRFVSASDGGRVMGNKVVWNLGTLAGDASRTLSLVLVAEAATSFENVATAKAYCVKPVSDWHKTAVVGIPAILLEVVDLQDPIVLGEDVTYEIRVTNQGSAPDTNIRISGVLGDSMKFVSGTGDTRLVKGDDNVVEFAPIKSLGPKQVATFRVKVKGGIGGTVLFRVKMQSDELGETTVDETEATRFYK